MQSVSCKTVVICNVSVDRDTAVITGADHNGHSLSSRFATDELKVMQDKYICEVEMTAQTVQCQ